MSTNGFGIDSMKESAHSAQLSKNDITFDISKNDLKKLFESSILSAVPLDENGFILPITKKKKTDIETFFDKHQGEQLIDADAFSKNTVEQISSFLKKTSPHPLVIPHCDLIIEDKTKIQTTLLCWKQMDKQAENTYVFCFISSQSKEKVSSAEQQRKWRKAINKMDQAALLLKKKKIIACNQAATDLFHASSSSKLKDHSFFSFIESHPSSRDDLEKKLGSSTTLDLFFQKTQCKTVDEIRFPAELLYHQVNEPFELAVLLIFPQLISINQNEAKIKEKAMDASINAIAITDDSGNITYVNNALLEMYGYAREELIDKPIVSLWKNKASYMLVLDSIINKGGWVGNLVAERKDETVFHTQLSATSIKGDDDKTIAMMTSFVDITKQKEAEENLIKSKNETELIINTAADGIRVVGTDFKVKRLNKTMAKMAGVSIDQGIGMNCFDMFGAKGICKTKKCVLKNIMDTKKPVRKEDERINVNGDHIPCMSVAHPYTDEKGEIIGIVEDFRDITMFKQAEEKILESERMKTEFMNMAAHELKTPLIPIRGYLEMIEKNLDLEEKQKKWINICLRNVDNLASLIQQVLDVARLESNSMKLNFESVNISRIIRDTTEDLKLSFKEKNLELITNIPKADICVHADEQRMKQVVRNFLSNALKYTLEGSVKISLEQKDNQALVNVKDTGIGLSKQDQEKLFQKFSRIESIETRKIKGTGLGLHITKKVVELHKGSVKVESKGRGKGTMFSFSIPLEKK